MFGFGAEKKNTIPIKGKAKFYIDGPIANQSINTIYFHTVNVKNRCFENKVNLFTDIDAIYPNRELTGRKNTFPLSKYLNSMPSFRIQSPIDPYNLTKKELGNTGTGAGAGTGPGTGTTLDYNFVPATKKNRGKIKIMKKCAVYRLKRVDKNRWYLEKKENEGSWTPSSDTSQNLKYLKDSVFNDLVAPDLNKINVIDKVLVIDTEEPSTEIIAIALPSKPTTANMPTQTNAPLPTQSTQTTKTGTGIGTQTQQSPGGGKKTKKIKKTKKVRKHKGINQSGGNKGKLKKGYRYSGKKLKSGLPQIIKCKSKKC